MKKFNKIFVIALVCLTLLGFAFLSLGGEFLHEHAHNHDHDIEQECPLYQFLIQSLIAFVVCIAAIVLKSQSFIICLYQSVLSQEQFSLPTPRAPPAFSI